MCAYLKLNKEKKRERDSTFNIQICLREVYGNGPLNSLRNNHRRGKVVECKVDLQLGPLLFKLLEILLRSRVEFNQVHCSRDCSLAINGSAMLVR